MSVKMSKVPINNIISNNSERIRAK